MRYSFFWSFTRIVLYTFFSLFVYVKTYAQALTPNNIWYEVIKSSGDYEAFLKAHGFKEKYSGPKKQGGWISCYRNLKADEWLYVYSNDSFRVNQVTYEVPALKKYLATHIENKKLLPGEEYTPMGRVYNQNKIYYQTIFRYTPVQLPGNNK